MGLLLSTQNSFDLSNGGAGGSQTIGQYMLKLWVEIYFPPLMCVTEVICMKILFGRLIVVKVTCTVPRDNVKSGLVAGNRSQRMDMACP